MTSQVLPTNVPSKNRADLLRLAARMTEEAEKIGRRMAERRKELGLTQRGVAERMPGSTQASDVSRWERGKHRPEPMEQIAEALETDVPDLVAGPVAERVAPDGESTDLLGAFSSAEPASVEKLEKMLRQVLDQQATLLAEISEVRSDQERQRRRPAPSERGRADKRS